MPQQYFYCKVVKLYQVYTHLEKLLLQPGNITLIILFTKTRSSYTEKNKGTNGI